MGIDTRVAGDETACRTTANALTTISQGIERGGTSFHTARSESEYLWQGTAGDAFRDRLQPIGQGVDTIASHTRTAGQALHGFADDLATVRSRMVQARQIAMSAGIPVTADTIEEPIAPTAVQGPAPANGAVALTPQAARAQQRYQAQQQAYEQATVTVAQARTIETNAHHTLNQQMSAWQTIVKDAADQKYWLISGLATGIVGEEIDKADEWGELAETRTSQAEIWQSVADRIKDPYDASRAAGQAGVYEAEAADFAKAESSATQYAAGLRGTQTGDFLSASVNDFAKLGGKLGAIADKIPVVGSVLALAQTGYGIGTDTDKSAGEVTKRVVGDMGGFAVGTASTEGLIALAGTVGLAGGPVTLGAVVIGGGVAYGVGELVNHWPDVSHWATGTASAIGHDLGDAAGTVGHAFGSAAHSVGDFFSSIF